MKHFRIPGIIAIALILTGAKAPDPVSGRMDGKEKVNWISMEEAARLNKANPRKWIVDCYTDWCGWCKKMDKDTFTDKHIIKEINENYYAVKFDAESQEDITLGGKTYKFVPSGRRGYHELAAELMGGKMSYPTLVFLNEKMNVIQPLPGYKTKQQLHPVLRFFSTDSHKTTKWEDFQKSYESPYAN